MRKMLPTLSLFLLAIGLCTVVWLRWADGSIATASYWAGAKNLSDSGLWGDSFGPLNTLFTAFGFAAVITTLVVQLQSISNQQRDQHLQRFESSFFQLLHLMRELRQEVKFKHSSEYIASKKSKPAPKKSTAKGPEAFTRAFSEARHWITIQKKKSKGIAKSQVATIYDNFVHKDFESQLGPYFRIVYTLLFRIDTDGILTSDEKARYGNLLRSQIPSHEMAVLALNGLSPVSKDMDALLEKFHMFKYLPKNAFRSTIQGIYGAEAFASRD